MRINEVKRLILKMLREELNSNEIQKLSNEKPLERVMIDQWQHAPQYHQLDHVDSSEMWHVVKQRSLNLKDRYNRKRLLSYSIAATVAILLAGAWLVNSLFIDRSVTIIGQSDHSMAYVLPDSSRVWVKEGSTVTYSSNYLENRMIKLKGEALFSVRKRQNAPFSVYTEQTSVTVKGTEFNIRESKENTEVTLFKGKVVFNTLAHKGRDFEMKPNDQIVYNSITGQVLKKRVDAFEYDWRLDEYVFTRKTLKELTTFLYHLHDVKIVFADESEAVSEFTGVIRKQESLSEILNKICISFNLHYKKEGDTILIY